MRVMVVQMMRRTMITVTTRDSIRQVKLKLPSSSVCQVIKTSVIAFRSL